MANDTKIATVQGSELDGGTASDALLPHPTLTATAAQLTESVGDVRNMTRVLSEDVDDIHRRALFVEWQSRTTDEARKSVLTLLDELADLGFGWSDIGRMLGVTVPAIRKWRTGGGASGASRRDVAALRAAAALIADHYQVEEIASWFEVPLVAGTSVTPIGLYAAGRTNLLFNYASGHVDPEQVLDEFDNEWRERGRSDFEVYRSSDSDLAIRPKG